MKTQIALRLPEALLRQVDERAKEVGVSRNQWIERVVTYALEQAGIEITVTTTERITL